MGLEPVCELDGGFTAWKAAGLPVAAYQRRNPSG
jgi:3-mercaptopyruvate sulfurtransferase SseA